MERPGKIVCVGRNYREHAKELGNEVPAEPLLFFKPASSVIPSGAAIEMPAGAGRVDYEGEVGIVIGAKLSKASEAQCVAAVRGIIAANDVSARDWQKNYGQWARAKGSDTFLPLGEESRKPYDLAALTLVTRVNGTERQRASTADLVFPIPMLLSFISRYITLNPNDVVLTGTPAGVGPLAANDVVEVEIVGHSQVRSPVVALS
ncbi:MAG TPA: fumarylacetoacetate hydrolase family protein [Gemmatimonadaceae bacterium]|nr:fumarylacetoacetate hydrolase family protein [Gemmatimonadaceae bacterium]